MAAIWKGSISFGLVNIPVSLQSAVREDHIGFRLLEKDTLCQVKYERVCKNNRKVIPWNNVVKGYEYKKGQFVVLTEADFEKAAVATSKAFEIEHFVPAAQIDPRYFETPYYVVPDEGSEPVYALLREAMGDSEMVGIGRITMRSKQHLAAIKPLGNALELNIMRFSNEVIDESHYKIPKGHAPKPAALKMAKQLIDTLVADFDPNEYHDQYRENLEKIIAGKAKGKEIEFEAPEEREATGVIDLMERLQQSLARKGGTAAASRKTTAKAAKSKTARTKKTPNKVKARRTKTASKKTKKRA